MSKKISQFYEAIARNDDDWLLIEEASTGIYKKIKVGHFLADLKSNSSSSELDSYFSNVSLLMHCDGTNNSIVFNDVRGNTITSYGSPVISTAQSKFNESSLYLNGNSGLIVSFNQTLQLSNEFTIEAWLYFISNLGSQTIASQWQAGSSGSAWMFYIANGALNLYIYNEQYFSSSTTLLNNQWYHVAVTRDSSNTCRFFIDGVMQTNCFFSSSSNGYRNISVGDNYTIPQGQNGNLNIGIGCTSDGSNRFNGYLDDIRITKGIARYVNSFATPTLPFP